LWAKIGRREYGRAGKVFQGSDGSRGGNSTVEKGEKKVRGGEEGNKSYLNELKDNPPDILHCGKTMTGCHPGPWEKTPQREENQKNKLARKGGVGMKQETKTRRPQIVKNVDTNGNRQRTKAKGEDVRIREGGDPGRPGGVSQAQGGQ